MKIGDELDEFPAPVEILLDVGGIEGGDGELFSAHEVSDGAEGLISGQIGNHRHDAVFAVHKLDVAEVFFAGEITGEFSGGVGGEN